VADAAVSADDVLPSLAVRGAITPEQLAEGLLSSAGDVEPLVVELVEAGLAERHPGSIRLSAEGKLKAQELFAADRQAIGTEACRAQLDSFHAFDQRMKQVVTAWQMRGEVLNDHGDAAYDAQVLDNLGTLHADLVAWLAPLGDSLPRYAAYRARLSRAVDLIEGGDQRYVASPRVDSYHSVWFELHEDLIRVAGRQRSEVSAD
jgi:pyruvate,orthophosphate dikinase